LDTCTNTTDDAFCSNGIFCDGAEVCDPALDCQVGSDPCAPLTCDEANSLCIAPIHVEELQVFYADRYRVCQGGVRDGLTCFSDGACRQCDGGTNVGQGCLIDADCPGAACPPGTCTGPEQPDPSYSFLSAGSAATTNNITNYTEGITGIRVLFDNIVDFATTADAAFLFEWSNAPICIGGDNDGFNCFNDNDCTGTAPTPNGTCEVLFESVFDAVNMIVVTPFVENNRTVAEIIIANGHVMRRWLKVTAIATEITSGGVELDGELAGNPVIVPSGDGFAGGDAIFYIGHVPADVDANRKVELTDPGLIRNCSCFNPFLEALITEPNDVDKDGRVVLTDVGKARVNVNPFFTLPLIAP
jgi:hypothetical protein